jgi:hypothetical protein
MTTRKTKKKRSDPLIDFFRHPLSFFGHLTFVRATIALLGLFYAAGAIFAFEPAGGAQNSSGSHAHDFVIFVTVFTERGFAFPGARARVRRAEEKKFRWEAMSDHQGELAFRVPRGEEYEMTIEARGFKTETRKLNSREGNRTDLTIRMEPQTGPPAEPQAQQLSGGTP